MDFAAFCRNPRAVLERENLESVYGLDVYGWMRSMPAQWGE